MPITQVEKIWMDGELVPWQDAQVHVLSHAVHYGSGVFEGIRAYETARGPAVWHLDEHLKRLFRSAKLYHMDIPFSIEAITDGIKDVTRANGLAACYIRPIVLRGYGEMGVNPLTWARTRSRTASGSRSRPGAGTHRTRSHPPRRPPASTSTACSPRSRASRPATTKP